MVPLAPEGLAGEIATLLSVAEVTVSGVVLLLLPSVALMMAVPGFNVALTNPRLPSALLMVAELVLPDAQVTLVVKSAVWLSLYVPVAVYC